MRGAAAMAGFSLVEMMIAVAVLGIVIMVGLPNVSVWLQNTQIKTSAEGIVSGLQLARAEGLRRNASVRFSLVDKLDNTCAISVAGPNWVVNVDDPADATDPAGACGGAASDAVAPFIVQKKSAAEGSPNAVLAADGNGAALFGGLGRLVGAGNLTQIDVTNPIGGGACQPGGPMHCLRVMVSPGGQVRMCDPAVPLTPPPATPVDPRECQ